MTSRLSLEHSRMTRQTFILIFDYEILKTANRMTEISRTEENSFLFKQASFL